MGKFPDRRGSHHIQTQFADWIPIGGGGGGWFPRSNPALLAAVQPTFTLSHNGSHFDQTWGSLHRVMEESEPGAVDVDDTDQPCSAVQRYKAGHQLREERLAVQSVWHPAGQNRERHRIL